MPGVTVLLAERHPLMRAGLRSLLEGDGRFVVAGECADGRELARRCGRLKPDVVRLDAQLPGLDGFLGAASARAARVVLLAHGGASANAEARSKVHAVLSKIEAPPTIVAAVAAAAQSGRRAHGGSALRSARRRSRRA